MREQEPLPLIEVRRRKLLVEKTYYQHKLDQVNEELGRLASGIETIAEKQLRARMPLRLPQPLEPVDYISPKKLRELLDPESDDPWENGMYGHEL